jgi:hypothetical protein
MFKWQGKSFAEILDLYGGNIFMAEMDYEAMGLSPADWAIMMGEAYRSKLISPTVAMLMIERASVK